VASRDSRTDAHRRRAEACRRWLSGGGQSRGARGAGNAVRCGRVRECGAMRIGRRGQRNRRLLLGWAISTNADTRISTLIRISQTYRNFKKIIKIWILHGYVSAAYQIRIRIRSVSDTRYTPFLKYPCNIDQNP
jgi:hypothetical protein